MGVNIGHLCILTEPAVAKASSWQKNHSTSSKKGSQNSKTVSRPEKKNLLACLQKKEKISDADEQWLDHDTNLVNKEAIIDALEKASDYKRGLTRLTPHQKGLVQMLKDLGNGVKQAALPSNKHKHM